MLFDTYSALVTSAPLSRSHLYGAPTNAKGGMWLAITEQAFPCLVIPARSGDFRSDIALHSIDVEFSRRCEIMAEDAEEIVEGTYTVIRLNDAEPDMVRLFLRLLDEAFCRGNDEFGNRQIGDKILSIADLFSRLDSSTGDLVGLWGELHLIAESSSVISAVQSWCSHKQAKYDFVCSAFVIEVKTTLRPTRQHRFSLEQLRPASDLQIYVASLQVIEVPSGKTVPESIECIVDQIENEDLRSAFLHRCIAKGGRDLYRSTLSLQCFPGGASLVMLRASDIPVPTLANGSPISQVRFDVDLTNVPSLQGGKIAGILAFPNEAA